MCPWFGNLEDLNLADCSIWIFRCEPSLDAIRFECRDAHLGESAGNPTVLVVPASVPIWMLSQLCNESLCCIRRAHVLRRRHYRDNAAHKVGVDYGPLEGLVAAIGGPCDCHEVFYTEVIQQHLLGAHDVTHGNGREIRSVGF